MKYYAGIGSRSTPQEIIDLMGKIAEYLSKDYVLRSGGADGADLAFENGCKGKKEIYLPWENFNGNKSNLFLDLLDYKSAEKISMEYHPAWFRLKQGARKLHTRNVFQILGKDLKTPVSFVVCYCEIKNGEWKGGTAQALRIAKDRGIKIYNLFIKEDFNKITAKIIDKTKENDTITQ